MAKIIKFERKITPEEEFMIGQGMGGILKDPKVRNAMVEWYRLHPNNMIKHIKYKRERKKQEWKGE